MFNVGDQVVLLKDILSDSGGLIVRKGTNGKVVKDFANDVTTRCVEFQKSTFVWRVSIEDLGLVDPMVEFDSNGSA